MSGFFDTWLCSIGGFFVEIEVAVMGVVVGDALDSCFCG